MREYKEESVVTSTISLFIDLIFAGILWLLTSLPIITIGPASSALYYTVTKAVRHGRGRIAPTFFSAFRSNFKQGLVIWLIYLAYVGIGAADLYALKQMGVEAGTTLDYISKFFFLPALLTLTWVFPFISRFENTLGRTLKIVALISIKNIIRTVALTALLLLFALVVWLVPLTVWLLPGVFCLLMSLIIEPVFKALAKHSQDSNIDQWYNE